MMLLAVELYVEGNVQCGKRSSTSNSSTGSSSCAATKRRTTGLPFAQRTQQLRLDGNTEVQQLQRSTNALSSRLRQALCSWPLSVAGTGSSKTYHLCSCDYSGQA
jgi:hypothetical protein